MEICSAEVPKTDIGLILSKLKKVRKTQRGWAAQCPGPIHQQGDRHPSLSISQAADGKILLFCHAGCSFQEIVAALGFETGDLSPGRTRPVTPADRRAAAKVKRERREERAITDWADKAYIKLCYVRRLYDSALRDPQDCDSRIYVRLLYFDHILDALQNGSTADKLSCFRAARAERLGLAGTVIVN